MRFAIDLKVTAQQKLIYTKHAMKRMKQRSLRPSEAELIYWNGTEVTAGEYFFRVKDANKLKAKMKAKKRITINKRHKEALENPSIHPAAKQQERGGGHLTITPTLLNLAKVIDALK